MPGGYSRQHIMPFMHVAGIQGLGMCVVAAMAVAGCAHHDGGPAAGSAGNGMYGAYSTNYVLPWLGSLAALGERLAVAGPVGDQSWRTVWVRSTRSRSMALANSRAMFAQYWQAS